MEENLYAKNSIRTVSGQYVNVVDPDPATILIEDIAHALAQIPRFGGHLKRQYSVAQHSVACCALAPEEFKLEALMHDASEAYLLDMPKPIKVNLPDYQVIENRMQKIICEKFGLPFPMSKLVKNIDKDMLEFEWNTLVLDNEAYLVERQNAYVAKKHFLTMFNVLTNKS